jgi:hypothetical protein
MTTLFLLLAALLLRARGDYDPFAPAGRPFPAARLSRAGVDDATVTRLRDEYAGMNAKEQRELARFVASNTNRRIADRYQGRRTREDLEHMTVDDELIPLLRERGLSTSGRKAELIDRLLDAYDTPTGALSSAQVPVVPDTSDDAPEAGSGDDRAGNGPGEVELPDGTRASGTIPASAAAPASAPSTQAPGPQTPDATPAPATAASADTTTKEAPRG